MSLCCVVHTAETKHQHKVLLRLRDFCGMSLCRRCDPGYHVNFRGEGRGGWESRVFIGLNNAVEPAIILFERELFMGCVLTPSLN